MTLFDHKLLRERNPPLKEIQIHFTIADLLRRCCSQRKWIWSHLPFGEKRDPETARKLWRMGVQPGWPDFAFISIPSGHVYFLELKSKAGDVSAAQWLFAAKIRKCETIEYEVARSVDEAIRILGAWGVVPVRTEDVA